MASDTDVRADAILAELDLTEDTHRDACITAAGVALSMSGGDPQAAKQTLSEVLQALGAIPYESGGRRTMWGLRPERPSEKDPES